METKDEILNLKDLKEPEKNVRKHPEKQIIELKRNVEKFGQYRPIVVDENNHILAGNGLYFALKVLGKEKVNVKKYIGLKELDKKRLMLADNRLFELGTTNHEVVESFLEEFKTKNDFDIPGFNEEILKELYLDQDMDYGKIEQGDLDDLKRNSSKIKQDIEITNKNIKVENGKPYIKCKCGETIWL